DLRGTGYGVLRWEGQDLQIRVDLQPTGTIRGQVFEADGVTPSVGAQIAVEINAFYWDWVYATTDEEGRFELTDLPISGGAYHLIAQDADGPGSWELWRDFTFDQEVHDHTLVLDEEDPRVVSVTPISGTRDLPRSTDVTIDFSEPMVCGGCLGEAVYIAKLTGAKVGADYSWNADKTQLTIQPHGLLANHTGYKIVVEREVNLRRLTDPSRRPVAWRHLSSFYTADELPPRVIEIRPKHGADQVPIDSGISIRFNEPVDLDSLSGAFTVVDLLTGTPFTLTTLPSLDQRVVTLTPVGGFSPDQHVELSLTGVRDGAGNQMTQVVTSRFWTPDATPPTITIDTPLVGQSFISGDPIEVSAQVTDNRAVERVTFRLDEWSKTLTSPPWVWDVPAPIRTQVDSATVIVEAEDRYGNIATVEREISITPLDNAVPPTVVTGCPVDLDFVAPGIELVVSAPVTDDLAVESAWLTVDGVEVDRETPIDAADHAATLRWTPPGDASVGTSFALVLHSRDFAGNVTTRPLTVSVPNGTFVTTDQAMSSLPTDLVIADARVTFDSPLSGGSVLVLQGGHFEADADGADLDLDAVRLQCDATARFETLSAATEIVVETGSTIRPRQLRTLAFDTNRLVVEADATLDAYGRGYYGWNDTPQAPSWVTKPDRGGGSHGGRGSFVTDYGRVYNSVYWPTLAGGGSSGGTFHTQSGSNGGGIVEIHADEMVLDGTIDIRGDYDLGISGAAGGSVAIDVGRLEGAGKIRGGGGATDCLELAGGGGRVAIWADELVDFDPAAQVHLRGGATDCGGSGVRPGAAGSLFVHAPDAAGQASTYGDLVIDNGGLFEAPRTVLPKLGAGDVTSVQVDGSDAWIVAETTFRPRWQGAWVRLENAAGDRLGTYRVLSADDDRLLLEGAASVVGASRYVGVYRFDDVALIDARLEANDPVEILGRLTIEAASELRASLEAVGHVEIAADTALDLEQDLVAGSMTIGENASVTTPDGQIRIDVAGLLDIQSGAALDVSGRPNPPWVPPSSDPSKPAGALPRSESL
ncbi:MAG: Ig-like domain-containing protein, partial [Acidobacteriota bacterium]